MRSIFTDTRIGLALAAAALLLCGGAAQAQETAPAPPPLGEPGGHIMIRTFGPEAGGMGFMRFEAGIAGKTVVNAPFTATVSTQITRTLADGNKIDQTITGTIARDSQGRTRRDMTLPGAMVASTNGGPAPHAVFINDPVADTSYILHPDSKIAVQVPFRPVKRILRAFRDDVGTGAKRRFANETATTDLGDKVINGVTAHGTRITRTIPAGQIGNERPIVIVEERWYSPDLQMNVLTTTNDPLTGNTVFQLTNIQRVEPDASLFQVPADYTVRHGPRRAMVYRQRGRGANPPPPPQD